MGDKILFIYKTQNNKKNADSTPRISTGSVPDQYQPKKKKILILKEKKTELELIL